LTGYADVARSAGLDPFDMLRRAGIGRRFLDDPENRYPADLVVTLLEESAVRSKCRSFGLLMAESRSFANLGPLSLLLQHLPTIDDVLRALIQYRRLMNDVITLKCERGGEASVIRWVIAPRYGTPQVIDLIVALGYLVLRGASQGRWTAEAVHFTHSPPGDLSAFRRIFAVRLEFESEFNGYSCSTASLRNRTAAPDPAMEGNARRLLNLVPFPLENAPAADRVRHALAVLIPIGRATVGPVAADLGVSPRTLQRSLALEETSFAFLLSEARKDMAQHYLANTRHSIGVVAALLGYSSSGSFSRWFVSLFGKSPLGWRRSMAAAAQSKEPAGANREFGLADEFERKFKASLADF
jgi:AraC-like DNA-binding protein